MIVPRFASIKDLMDEYGRMDGLLIVEGEELEPWRYGGNREQTKPTQDADPDRDEIEFELMSRAGLERR